MIWAMEPWRSWIATTCAAIPAPITQGAHIADLKIESPDAPAQTIPLVAGFDWAYDLSPLREEPIDAENIAYVSHPYPWKRQEPWQPKWDEDFGFASSTYPVIATEIGFGLRKNETIGPTHYGYQITKYLEQKGISWTAWVFDPEWGPNMLKSWNYDLTEMGSFFKQVMKAK